MATKYIYSTLSANQAFKVWAPKENKHQLARSEETIIIHGMANIANKKTFQTFRGAVTPVTDEQLKSLEAIPQFARMVKRGYLAVDTKKADADKAADNMAGKDKSAQLTPKDIKAGEGAKLKTN